MMGISKELNESIYKQCFKKKKKAHSQQKAHSLTATGTSHSWQKDEKRQVCDTVNTNQKVRHDSNAKGTARMCFRVNTELHWSSMKRLGEVGFEILPNLEENNKNKRGWGSLTAVHRGFPPKQMMKTPKSLSYKTLFTHWVLQSSAG